MYPLGVLNDQLIYVRIDGAIMAVPIDVGRRRVVGNPVVLESGVSVRLESSLAQADLSESGTLIFSPKSIGGRVVLADRRGASRILTEKQLIYGAPRFSPDGKRLALLVGAPQASEIWVTDIVANTSIRLAEARVYSNRHPAWAPDGKRIAFSSGRGVLLWQAADASSPAEPLASARDPLNEVTFSPDGRWIVVREGSTPFKLAYRSLVGDTTLHDLVTSDFEKYQPAFSPDGHWVAYTSYETGEPRVYVCAFPGPPSKWPVSDGLGTESRWAPDGRSIFYRGSTHMIAARVVTIPTFEVRARDTLFADTYVRAFNHREYDVSPDGKTFAMIAAASPAWSITVVLNWRTELAERVRAR